MDANLMNGKGKDSNQQRLDSLSQPTPQGSSIMYYGSQLILILLLLLFHVSQYIQLNERANLYHLV